MSSRNGDKQQGFTLIELMVTLALVAILVTIGIPGFSNIIRDNRLVTGTNDLVTSMSLARSEAIRRGVPVTVCASNTGTDCTASAWNQGWIVFTDQGTADTVDGTDTILRVQQALAGNVQIAVGGATQVRYSATGFLAAAGSAEDTGGLFAAGHDPESLITPMSRLIAMLMPGQPAFAAHYSSGGYGNHSNHSSNSNHSGGYSGGTGAHYSNGNNSSQGGNSSNSNVGSGNNGNGVGNTGPGNQGNDQQVGNAGGSHGNDSTGTADSGGGGSSTAETGSGSTSTSSGSGGSGSGVPSTPLAAPAGATAALSTFTLCDGRTGETGRQVTIMASGRIASQSITCDQN